MCKLIQINIILTGVPSRAQVFTNRNEKDCDSNEVRAEIKKRKTNFEAPHWRKAELIYKLILTITEDSVFELWENLNVSVRDRALLRRKNRRFKSESQSLYNTAVHGK